MTIRGYGSQEKLGDNQYATVSPVRERQHGLDVIAHTFMQEIGSDQAETGSTTRTIVATAHTARVGDVVSFTSGALATLEARVYAVDVNLITLVENLPSAPANGDAFDILRQKTPIVDSQGQLSVGVSLSAEKDAGPTTADTLRVVIANDQATGPIATEATLAALAAEDFATEATLADVEALVTSLEGKDFATETTLAAAAADLSAIAAEDFATETTLAAIAADTASIDSKLAGDYGASTGAIRTASQIGNASGAAAFGSGAVGGQVLRTTPASDSPHLLATRHEAATTPVAVRAGNGTIFNTYGAGAADSATQRVAVAASTTSFQSSGKIAGTSLTGTYATLLDPGSIDLRILCLFNSCNQTIFVSINSGVHDTFELEAGESVCVDLASNGLKISNTVEIMAKHAGVVPTSGTIRATGIG